MTSFQHKQIEKKRTDKASKSKETKWLSKGNGLEPKLLITFWLISHGFILIENPMHKNSRENVDVFLNPSRDPLWESMLWVDYETCCGVSLFSIATNNSFYTCLYDKQAKGHM